MEIYRPDLSWVTAQCGSCKPKFNIDMGTCCYIIHAQLCSLLTGLTESNISHNAI